jgi:hypothetical protein
MNDLRKYISIITEAQQADVGLNSLEPEYKDIAKDIKAGEVSDSVLAKLVQFLQGLVQSDSEQQTQEPAPAVQQPQMQAPAVQEPGTEPQVEEALGANDLQVYSLLKQANPERAEQVWAFYNKQMLADYLVPALKEKDIIRQDDHDRIIGLFVEAPGTLEDKLAIAMRLDTTGEKPNTGGGIINIKKLTTQGKGSINDLITVKNSPVVDYIKEKLIWMRVYPSTTSAATGDGEAFFLILGAGITKRGKGDLNVGAVTAKKDKLHQSSPLEVNGKEVEVKAQGARLKGFGGKGTYGDGATYYKTFNDQLLSIIGPDGSAELDALCPPTKATAGWQNGSQAFNFVGRNLNAMAQVLSNFAKKNGSKPSDVKAMFEGMIHHVYPKATPEMYKPLLSTINSKCSFDVDEFRKQWFLMTYEYYLETSRDKTGQTYDGILFIHQPSFTYSYVKDGNEISNNWTDFELNTSLYNWTDTQSVAPKITYGKEVRVKEPKTPKPQKAAKVLAPNELAPAPATRTARDKTAGMRKLK